MALAIHPLMPGARCSTLRVSNTPIRTFVGPDSPISVPQETYLPIRLLLFTISSCFLSSDYKSLHTSYTMSRVHLTGYFFPGAAASVESFVVATPPYANGTWETYQVAVPQKYSYSELRAFRTWFLWVWYRSMLMILLA